MKRKIQRLMIGTFCLAIALSGLYACAEKQSNSAFFPFEQDKNWGVIDRNGKVIVEPKFVSASRVPLHRRAYRTMGQESVVLVGKEEWLFVTNEGIKAFEPPVTEDCLVSNRGQSLFAVFVSADLTTLPVVPSVTLDPLDLWKPPKDFKIFGTFSEGLVAVIHNKTKIGYADRHGKVVIEPKFDEIGHFVFSDGCFHDGIATAKLGEKWGYIDRKGNWVLKPQFRQVTPFDRGVAVVFPIDDASKPVVIDRKGRTLCNWFAANGPRPSLRGYPLNEGRSLVRDSKSDLLGFVDFNTNWKLPPVYVRAYSFHEGLAPVVAKKRDESGYIDHDGNVVVAVPKAKDLFWFSRGLAFVKTRDGNGYINRAGNWVWKQTK